MDAEAKRVSRTAPCHRQSRSAASRTILATARTALSRRQSRVVARQCPRAVSPRRRNRFPGASERLPHVASDPPCVASGRRDRRIARTQTDPPPVGASTARLEPSSHAVGTGPATRLEPPDHTVGAVPPRQRTVHHTAESFCHTVGAVCHTGNRSPRGRTVGEGKLPHPGARPYFFALVFPRVAGLARALFRLGRGGRFAGGLPGGRFCSAGRGRALARRGWFCRAA